MKILAKIKRKSVLIGILFTMLIIGIVYAADSYQVNSGTQVTIDEHTVCKKVTNNNALAIFVPTKTADEWTAFRTNASGVSITECCNANGLACSSDADCCSGICGTNADGDNYFSEAAGHTGTCQATALAYTDCCDSDSRAYPGEATYYGTINNCGSWDYNCSGGVSKHSYYCDKITSCTCKTYTTEWCGETCEELLLGGINSYYECGETGIINACCGYYSRSNCSYADVCWEGVGMSPSVAGITDARWVFLCGPPVEPSESDDNAVCTCH